MASRDGSTRASKTTGFSRRGFLKGAGALAAGPILAQNVIAAEPESPAGLSRCGPDAAPLDLNINGKAHSIKVEPRVTLLEVLRDRLDMTGSKEICSRGACGGCTVFVDGRTVNSCLMLAVDAAGCKITTIEGLASGDQLDPVQAAFAKHDALQCGYCTPGFVMSVKSLVAANPKPTVDDVRKACAGNICRCGTYNKIFEAALAAAGIETPVGNLADNASKALENNEGRVDAALKVTGKAKYTADINLPNMAYAAIVYCPFGRATLKSSDVEAAKRIPGVLDVEIEQRDQYVYCGQPTGHVCADNRQSLADAVAALNLQWEIQPPVLDPVAAHGGPIPPPMEQAANDRDRERVPDAKKILADAKNIIERTYTTQIQTHACLEPHCALAHHRGDSAEMWCSSQSTSAVHDGAVAAFGLNDSQVRAHCEFVGGGFGSKFEIGAEGQLAASLSKKLGRPVKVVNDRKREHLDTGCRPGSIQYMKIALTDEGRPGGGHVHVVGVSGPGGGGDADNPSRYELGNIIKTFKDVVLSVGSARPMRAPGRPQGMFAVDSFVDELAANAKSDPLEYRRLIDPNPIRKQMYEVGAGRIGWSGRPRPDGSGNGHLRRGIGVGVGSWFNMPRGSPTQIRIDVFRDGTVRVLSGTQDIGTGNRSVLVDMTRDHLKIDRKLISADCGNSDYPQGPGSGGSFTARTISTGIRDAADQARKKLAGLSGSEPADTESWRAACKKIAGESFTVLGDFQWDKYYGSASTGRDSSEAVQFAEVEVDAETGVVTVRRVVALQNVGQAVNRLTTESQIIGGVIQGVSFALHEEKILDPRTGAMVNPNLEMYKILGPIDCPEIVPIIWREGDGNLGVRALGEPPVIPTAGAVANAVANAIGARIRSLPITPAKVLAALAERSAS